MLVAKPPKKKPLQKAQKKEGDFQGALLEHDEVLSLFPALTERRAADYIDYDGLKKWLYLVEKAKLGIIKLPSSYRNVNPDVFVKASASTQSPRLSGLRPVTPKRTRIARTPTTPAADASSASEREEQSPLLGNSNNNHSDDEIRISITSPTTPISTSLESFFIEPLDDQLAKIVRFYNFKKSENLMRIQDLLDNIAIVEGFDSSPSLGSAPSGIGLGGTASNNTAFFASSSSSSSPTNNQPRPQTPTSSRAPPARKTSRRSMSGSFVSTSDSEASGWPGNNLSSSFMSTNNHPNTFSYNFWNRPANKLQRAQFRSQAAQLYAELKELQEYIAMNHSGFSKILKKYEKVTGFRLKARYMAVVEATYTFRPEEAADLKVAIDRVVEIYARVACDNDLRAARADLESKCRQRITIERNTVWKDMVEQGGRTMSIVEARRKPDGEEDGFDEDSFWRPLSCCFGCIQVWVPWFITARLLLFLAFVALLVGLIQADIFESSEQQNCFAIFVFASGMWAFEVVPLFVTSAMVPFLVVTLRVMRDTVVLPDGTVTHPRYDAKGQAKRVFADMFSPVIMLLLGGFSLGSAVSKHGIAKMLASVVLDKAGSDPKIVILANMFVSTFASMWISNVAAPALCFPLISPILRNLPTNSTYAKALIMGIALAANVGGMASPIASPQNIIAIGIMNPGASWFEWFVIALPVCIVIDLGIWGILLLIYRPKNVSMENAAAAPPSVIVSGAIENGDFAADTNVNTGLLSPGNGMPRSDSAASDQLPPISQYMTLEPLNAKQWYILGVTFSTIMLWCIEKKIEWLVGDMGVIALLPIIAFYGTGILSKDDWNQQLWNVVMLAMGGICLGKAVDSSGLLAYVTSLITPQLQGLSAYMCMFVFSLIVLVITSFISHTVGALIILPVVAEIGATMPDPQPRMLVMMIALVCSGAMGLPVSSFPNMNAISQQDAVGVPYITVVDFHKVGLLSSVVAWGAIVTLGYYCSTLIGFK
ncbi:low-affinity phosphate transporter [Chytriomyces hyalinus]|nr:low-affinity phosphate transporter [Chytriomyces hyalinus]